MCLYLVFILCRSLLDGIRNKNTINWRNLAELKRQVLFFFDFMNFTLKRSSFSFKNSNYFLAWNNLSSARRYQVFFWSQPHYNHGDLATIIIKPIRLLVTEKKTMFWNISFLPISNEIHSYYDNVFNIPIKFSHFLFEKNYNYYKIAFISCSFLTK